MRATSAGTLAATHVTVVHGTHPVLADVSLVVGARARIGIVGPNGVGKSTLLRVLAGLELPEAGVVDRAPPTLTVGYLPQEVMGVDDESLLAYVARRTGVAAASAALDEATAALETDPDAMERHADALQRFLDLGGDDLESRAAEVCADVGLGDATRLQQPLTAMSGGQRARAGLAAILLSRFDVLLLDEPTNDLDFAGLELLERFVVDTPAALVLVSHDRAFLDRVIERVVELDGHDHTAKEYAGGWSAYLDERALERAHGYENYERYRGERDRLLDRSRQQRRWAERGRNKAVRKPADPDKFIRRRSVEATERLAAKAKATERAMERLEVVEKPWEGWELRLELPPAPRSSDVVVRLDSATVSRGPFTLGPIDLEIRWQDRLAIVGPNGSGNTTLLRALLGEVPLASGARHWGSRIVVGELDQARHALVGERELLGVFCDETGMLIADARTLLAKFELGPDEVLRPTTTLSPGERTRALLALLVAKEVNLLVLDEPTNHLDLPAIEQLEGALENYDGTLVLVTHDRRLLDNVRITRTLEL
ncbi:MAG: ABC-F family ATP-binding cassette domain-containing protein [Acidimicrobiia bacterium]|nr:ABC-F family ATP-binding cassette domain-containing protein [Acidimicrobiia bacterium]